jgi:zinc/manganese transport system substrate-binding protein
VVATGAELEIGWLPLVLQQAGNPAVQPGKPGYFEAAQSVQLLEIPTKLDRAEGDVHAAGNPHIQMDPRNIAHVAEALSKRMAELDSVNAAAYQTRYQSFSSRWSAAMANWEKEGQPLKGVAVIVHHRAFSYLENWLGLKEVAALEPKPGLEPTSSHLTEVLELTQRQPVKMVVRSAYLDPRADEWIAARAKIPVVVFPLRWAALTVPGSIRLFEDTVQRLLAPRK